MLFFQAQKGASRVALFGQEKISIMASGLSISIRAITQTTHEITF